MAHWAPSHWGTVPIRDRATHPFGVWESAKPLGAPDGQPVALEGATAYGRQLSWGTLRGEPATIQFDWSFAPMPTFDDRFARQNRFGPPPEFPLASPYAGIVHWISGRSLHTLPQPLAGHLPHQSAGLG